jgi:tetratricopeptide (TPR) repeat protein
LRRLVALHDAYALANEADELLNSSRHDEAARLYVEASERAPGNHELLFWAGLGTAQAGDLDAGVEIVRAAIALQPTWHELLHRLAPEVAPSAAAVLARVRDG